MNLISRRIKQLKVSLTYVAVLFLVKIGFFKDKFNDIWLISERGIDARDNGYFFYKYLKEKHPEINSYFIITPDSADYNKVSLLGNIIEFNSLNHYVAMIKARYLISTHIYGYTPEMNIFIQMDKRNIFLLKGKKIFLQHGIIKDKMNINSKLDLFVTSVEQEYKFIKKNYPQYNKSVVLTGMPRYDNLFNSCKNTILLMPTWRLYLQNVSSIKGSIYLDKYVDFLNDKRLEKILEKNNLKLIFYPHIEMQRFLNEFSITNKHVKIASLKDYDVQDLLKSSKLLITDYSSVFFDYSYLEKPLIYYQFDYNEFRGGHYSEGYFDYKQNGFGPVLEEKDDLIKQIELYIKNNFEVSDVYKKRITNFFCYRDNCNSERVFKEINKL